MTTDRVEPAWRYLQGEWTEPPSNRQMSEWFQRLTADEIQAVLQLANQALELLSDPQACQRFERAVPYLAEASRHTTLDDERFAGDLQHLYRHTRPAANLRNGWLYWLAVVGSPIALTTWRDLMRDDPPECRAGIVWPFAPLLKKADLGQSELREILDLSMPHPAIASCALDLLNFRFREGLTVPHAADERIGSLAQLMGSLAQQLAAVEEGRLPANASCEQISRLVGDSVALLTSLCDAVALCQYREGEGKLRQVAALKHRRLQVEAYSALARMGFEEGREGLIQLAAEPSLRLRVLKYARELGLESRIDERFRTPEAMAASQLAMWLAEPQQMGIAPSRVEVIDRRRQFWPGFDNPIDCYLLRFEYGAGERRMANVGIVGPMVYAFDHDISGLSFNDLYAAFAGWQVVHDELYEISMDEAYRTRGRELERQLQTLRERAFQDIQPQFVARFFGDWVLVVKASLHQNRGIAIVDDQDVTWYIDDAVNVDPQFAYWVYRGGRLLRSFNQEEERSEP